MSIGKRIISSREKKGWNQRELARKINLNASVMNRIELGDRPIKDHELASLSDVLDVTSDYLLGLTDNPRSDINIAYDGGSLEVEDEDEEQYLKEQLAQYRKMKKRMQDKLAKDNEGK